MDSSRVPSSIIEQDDVPELPTGPERMAATNEMSFHRAQNSISSDERSKSPPRRRPSNASHVAVDYFDPEGVSELKRTFTRQSATRRPEHIVPPPTRGSLHSELTAVSNTQSEKFDFEQHLKDMIRRSEEQDIKHRQLGVVFQNLRVQGLGSTASYQPTMGSLFNPLLIPEKIRQIFHPIVRDILTGFEGVVNPGEMLLVLGRPGSGCSTLLKTLANQHEEYYNVSGMLHFSSFTPKQIHKHYRGDVVYCPEDDVHFPTLTVGETLRFAASTRIPSSRVRLQGTTRSDYIEGATNTLATIFGLRHVLNTKVGNAAIRGVSGGERKRVSIAEALVTRAKIGAWDNSTRGLDASTALEFVRALRIATDNLELTSIVSIYQASELLYKHFDKVCVIYEGKMAYYGPAEKAREYFYEMGWEPANRQTTADFLVAVTDPNGRTARKGYENRVPRTADEFVKYFQSSEIAAENRANISAFLASNLLYDDGTTPDALAGLPPAPSIPRSEKEEKQKQFIMSAHAERAKHSNPKSPYTISIASQIREVMKRRVMILKGDWSAQAITLFSYVFQAIIMGTIFFNLKDSTSAFFSRGGVLFFAILFGALTSMAEIPALYSQRPIVNRHAKAAMYHPFVESIALTIVDVPISAFTLVIFSVILYFLVGLQRTAAQYFTFLLLVITVSLTMKAFFRSLAAAFKSEANAQSLAGIFTLALVLYTGFTIPKPTMIGALRWITYINPLSYGFEAILVNEFHTLEASCASLVPSGAGYENVTISNQVCATVGAVSGSSTVDGNRFVNLSYGYSYTHLWRNFGIVVGFGIFFVFLLNLFTEINTSSEGETSVVLYKRGAKAPAVDEANEKADEEKGGRTGQPASNGSFHDSDEAMREATNMTDVFSWQNLNYVVPIGKNETRKLLDDVSGFVMPGKLTALMGESGAGKTTLLNVLAGRTDVGVITGDRFVNGHELPHDFQSQAGYCQQMDTHLPETTVREALLFSAKLRQPESVPLAEKEAYVETCLKMCGLEDHADAIVGTLGVEHKKRTTIGVELAAKPKLLLFLDEPTSGLDSQSAWAITSFLRDLADHGQAILCTIHQPSSELFQVFDRLLLLRKGGQTVYFGDLGKNCETLISYFESNGARKCEPDENPAEWMLDVIGAGATATSTIDWRSVWVKSEEAEKAKARLDEIHAEGRQKPPVQASRKSEFATSWFYQLIVLTNRAFVSYWRNPTYIMAKLILNVGAGLFIGFTFFKSPSTMQGTQNRLFAVFMGTILSAALANQLQVVFINFRNIYEVRERPSRMYSWTSLVTSQLLVEIPWNIFGSSLYFLCWYWTVGFETSRAGYTYLMIGILFPLYYTTIAEAVAAMAPNAVLSSVLFSTLFSFVISFNGVMQPYRLLGWWKWMYRVSPFTYLIEGLVGQAIGKMDINCSSTEFVTVEPLSGQTCAQYLDPYISVAGGYLENPDASSACQYCSSRTTDQFLELSFNVFYSHHWRNLGLFCVYIVFNTVMIYVLTYLFRIRSRR